MLYYKYKENLSKRQGSLERRNVMSRDEILRKSREQMEDEGVIYAENTGRRYGFIGLSITLAAYMILVLFNGGNYCIPMSFWCAFTGSECIGRYKSNSQKSELLGGIILCLSAITFFLSYVLRDLLKVI